MKKLIVLFVLVLGTLGSAWAQGYAFVNSELIFKSQTDYNDAIKQLDELSALYQKNIDDAYAELDKTYNNFVAQKNYLSETNQKVREDEIVAREKEIKKYQEDVFGQEGDLMKKRVELIKPIQDRVFEAINQYATTNQLGMIVDRANNQTLLYYSPALDKTDEIINMLKK